MEFKKGCHTCVHSNESVYDYPCSVCENYGKWEASWIVEWLNSFDTNSATKCFEAVNLLKQRLEEEDE